MPQRIEIINNKWNVIPHGALGHYHARHRAVLAATQAANSRIFEVRNTHASNLIIPINLTVTLYQTAAGTAQAMGLDAFRLTSFSAVDTTNVVTPTAVVKRTTGMAAGPGAAAIRGVTAAGAAAGMTGGTLTKDSDPFWSCDFGVGTAIGAASTAQHGPYDLLDYAPGEHPAIWENNQGVEIENRLLNVTSYGVTAVVDFSWAEVTSY